MNNCPPNEKEGCQMIKSKTAADVEFPATDPANAGM